MKHKPHWKEIFLYLVKTVALPLVILNGIAALLEYFGYQQPIFEAVLLVAKVFVFVRIMRHPIPSEFDSENSSHINLRDLLPGMEKLASRRGKADNKND